MSKNNSISGKVFDTFNVIFLILVILITIYPLLYIVFASISDPVIVRTKGGVLLWPINPTLQGYKSIFKGRELLTGFENTFFYVVVGTSLNVFMTALGAYVLSRKQFLLRNHIMFMIVFTMYFSGGLIPTYFVVRSLHLLDNRFALIIPSAISAWNLILMRTSFASIPNEIDESAKVDGANDFTILFRIIIPLSTAIIAVMALFYGVAHWNSWFPAAIYLRDKDKYPIQLLLREILIVGNITFTNESADLATLQNMYSKMLIKYSVIVVSTFPILFVYPFIQKYFVKGIMIGSLKG